MVKVHGGRFIMMDVNCPECNLSASVTLLRFIQAINQGSKWHCADCGCEFTVQIVSLTRATELRNEADTGGQDGRFWNCPRCHMFNYQNWLTCAKCDAPRP